MAVPRGGSGETLRSAFATAVFMALCGAAEFAASHPAGKSPIAGSAPRVLLYIFATLLFFQMDSPGPLGWRRLIKIGLPLAVASAAAIALPAGAAERTFLLAAAVGLGLTLGRLAAQTGRSPSDLLGILLIGTVCDTWVFASGIYECEATAGPWLLRPPGSTVPAAPWMSVPAIDIVFLGAFLEMSRRYGFHAGATISGAWTGFAGASLIQVALRRPVPAIPLAGLGVLIAAWPQLRLRREDARRAAAAVLVAAIALVSLAAARSFFVGKPEPPEHRLEDLRRSI